MLSKLLITTAVSGMIVTGAIAQETRTAPANNAATSAQSAQASGKFIPAQGADQWVFSKFKGTDVLGPDNTHIGDVTDLLFDKNGKVDGVVVGVGGFLGIGEKNVAIDMSAFQVVPPDVNSSTASRSDDPNNIKLKVAWTKDELKNAPDFQYYKAASRTSGNPPATTGAAPRPAPAPANPPAPR
jgi:hypothetical protein